MTREILSFKVRANWAEECPSSRSCARPWELWQDLGLRRSNTPTSFRAIYLQLILCSGSLVSIPLYWTSTQLRRASAAMQSLRQPLTRALRSAPSLTKSLPSAAYASVAPPTGYASTNVNLRVDDKTKVIFQGFTGRQVRSAPAHNFPSQHYLNAYGYDVGRAHFTRNKLSNMVRTS